MRQLTKIKDLPAEIQKMAQQNMRAIEINKSLNKTLELPVITSFPFRNTPQGMAFWFKVIERKYNIINTKKYKKQPL